MEKKTIEQTPTTTTEVAATPVKKQKGGKQEGAGRKKGTKNLLSVHTLLNELERQSGGKPYEELLVADFLHARGKDLALTVKYHQLIVSRVMKTTAEVEISTPQDEVAAKQAAFDSALAKLVGVGQTKKD